MVGGVFYAIEFVVIWNCVVGKIYLLSEGVEGIICESICFNNFYV